MQHHFDTFFINITCPGEAGIASLSYAKCMVCEITPRCNRNCKKFLNTLFVELASFISLLVDYPALLGNSLIINNMEWI